MDTFSCAHCGQPHRGQVAPRACQRCGQPMSSSSGMGELSLDLKEMVACNRCGHEAYEEAFTGGVCPRCHETQEEEEGDEEPSGPARGGPRRRGGRPARPGGRKKKAARAAPTPPPEKRKVILTEEFKAQVFGAIRMADARTAQQLCFELVGENETHAKQIYDHLLGIAKKKGWVGIDVGRAPAPAGPGYAPPTGPGYAAPAVPLGPPPGQPLDPLPLPAGILGGERPPGQPLDPLPMPAGILGGPTEAPTPYPAPAPYAAPPPYGAAPTPYPASAAEPAPAPAAPQPAPAQPAPARSASDDDPDPEERGFFNRVAVAGRAAQASLLCLAGRFAAAKDLAESTLARDPGAARGLAALAEAQAGLGDEQAALQTYASAVRADPADPAVIRGYAQLLMRLGRFQEAIGAYQRIVGPGKGELRDAVSLAAALRKVGNVQGAQRVIEEVVKRDPQSLEPVRQEAEAKAARGDLDGAARLLDQLLGKERAPYPLASALAESIVGRAGASVLARLACAKVFVAIGRPFQAVRLLGPVLSGGAPAPLLLEARRRLGLAYAALGAGAQAEEHLLAVVQQGAGGAEELRALGVIYLERGDTDKGVRALMRARDAAPDDAPTRRELARALAAADDLEGAIRELTAAHERAGSDDQALEDELVRITERAFAKRVKELETRLLADEQDVEARLELARAHGQRGDLPAAIEQLEWVQGRDPGAAAKVIAAAEQVREEGEAAADRALTLLLARLHAEAGGHERAIEVLEEYLAAEPEDPEGRLALLDHYARGQRVQDAAVGLRAYLEDANPFALERAVGIAERILAEHQGHAALVLSVARSRRRLGDTEAAVGHLRRYVEAAPDDTEARVELARLLEAAGRRGEAYDVLKVLVEGGAGSTAELERLASLALGAGSIDDAVAHLRRAVERHPEDLALKNALEATEARARRARLAALEGSQRPEDRLELAGLLIEEGNAEQATALLRALGRLEGSDPELATLRFSAEWFARRGKGARAEAALRAVGRRLGYAPGADAHKDLLARIGAMYERAGERAAARRVYLEIYSQDPQYRDVAARLENLSEDVRAAVAGADERVLDLVDLGAPLGSVLETLQGLDLALDPRLLAGSRSSASLEAQKV